MLFFLILGVLLGAVTVVFALQNITTIAVNFFGYQLEGSLSLILLLAVASGVLICLLVSIPEVIKNHMNIRALRKENQRLHDEVSSYKRIVGDVASVTERTPTAANGVSSVSATRVTETKSYTTSE